MGRCIRAVGSLCARRAAYAALTGQPVQIRNAWHHRPCSLTSSVTPGSALTRAGAPHRPDERIGAWVPHQPLEAIGSGATIDGRASDQVIPFTSLAEGTSRLQVPFITAHAQTGAWPASVSLGAEVLAQGQSLTIRATDPGACVRAPATGTTPPPAETSQLKQTASRWQAPWRHARAAGPGAPCPPARTDRLQRSRFQRCMGVPSWRIGARW
jgi:RNA 3'-terminal phosphate cyclase